MKRIVTAAEDGRLDVWIAQCCDISRSQAAKWIATGYCSVNGSVCTKAGTAVHTGDVAEVEHPEAVASEVIGEEIPITILYQDEDIAVVNKPCGMVVHPAAGNETGTLVNALLYAMDDLSGIGGVKRPGIVHRLDKDTSGVILIAKNDTAHVALSKQLKDRTMEKHYLAVVEGAMKEPQGLIDQPIGRSTRDRKKMAVFPKQSFDFGSHGTAAARDAQTEWTVLEPLKAATLLDVHILTGRTHQIRVHMQSVGHPVAGDPIYGLKHGVSVPRLMLHAYTLRFTHPRTGKECSFTAPPPEEFAEALQKLRLTAVEPPAGPQS